MKSDKAGSSKKLQAISRVAQSENVLSLNYIYQLAAYRILQAATQERSLNDAIARSVQIQSLTRKATLRLDTTIKRTICKRCSLPLLPGVTSSIRVRASLSTARAVEIKCLVCSRRTQSIALPQTVENSNKIANRHRRIQQRKERKLLLQKVARHTGTATTLHTLSNAAAKRPHDKRTTCTSAQRWSQRTRRRAGKLKAQLLKESKATNGQDDVHPATFLTAKETLHGRTSTLPTYTNRVKNSVPEWDKSWPPNTMPAEKEAIRILRGDHLITSGLGRGGATGEDVSVRNQAA